MSVLGVRSYPEALQRFSWTALWDLFDGDRERLNVAHECVDRHPGERPALRIQFADGRREEHSFGALAAWSARFANFLESEGVGRGERVAVMLEPSLAFYGAVFGAMKRGAVAVPVFTLFGSEGVALRLDDCAPAMLIVERDAERWRGRFPGLRVVEVDERLATRLDRESPAYAHATGPDELAVFQYTSGTTREVPEAVHHTHRSVVTLMVAALYGVGLERGDRYFCPSSPAWGHGLWHGTIAPLALGITLGAYAGRFDARRLWEALEAFEITNLAAAPTVFRMLRDSGVARSHRLRLRKVSFTGEPMDRATWEWVAETFGVRPCSMYGSTEVGVIICDYPGFIGHEVRCGALGRPAPGWEVGILDEGGRPVPAGETGEIAVRRRGEWFPVKDRGWMDADGYVWHSGRSDDVIISAGWTLSALEIEQALRAHPDVRDAAVVGVPDATRGQVPKAYLVTGRRDAGFAREIQEFVKARLGLHEYPRHVEIVASLPRTPAGKIDRKRVRELTRGTSG